MISTDSKKYFSRAFNEINARRSRAKLINDEHYREIENKIPEFSVINAQLAQTGKDIIAAVVSRKNAAEKLEKLKQSNLEAQGMIKRLLTDNGYPEDYLDIKYTCEKCGDTGFVGGYKCSCLKDLMASMAMEDMNSSSQIKLCDFGSFSLSMYKGKDADQTLMYRDIMSRIFDYCRRYADSFTTSSGNIFMFGGTGLGKTHLSLSIAKEVLKKGYSVLYDSALNYLGKIEKEHFGRGEEGADTLAYLLDTDLLILDDLGTEYDKPFYSSTLYTIINTRLNKNMPTIISSNLNQNQMMAKYDERLVSRLFAAYTNLQFVGRDIRIIKRHEKNGA